MNDHALLAHKLKPYILDWIAGGEDGGASGGGGSVGAHALSGAQHTGQLAQSQAPWAATVDALNAHALNVNAHHAQVHGLDSTNHTGTLAWAKVSKTGSDLAHLQARAHGSLTGIGPNDHHNKVHDITGADHTIGGSAWDVVGKTAAGALGFIASLDNVSGGQTVLLRSNAGLVTVKQATASDRLRAPILDTASGNLTLQPAGDLLLSPGGSDVIIDDADILRSDNFLAGFPLAGFRIGPTSIAGQTGMQAGSGEFDELRARIFVADETRVDRGQEYITKSYGILSRAFAGPAAVGGTAFLYVENSPHIAGAVFSTNDWVLLRYLDMSSGILLTSVWGQVSAYNVTGLTGEQRWTFTLRQGTGSLDFGKGAMVVCFGASGQGYILSDAITSTSPFIQIGKWVTNPYTPANRTVLTQVGRLDGVGFSGEYGLAASVNGFGANDSWLKAATGGVAINNADATWTVGGVEIIKVAPAVGIKVNAQIPQYDPARAYKFVSNAGADVGGLYGSYQAGAGGASYVGIFANDNQAGSSPTSMGYVEIVARRTSTNPASVALRTTTALVSNESWLEVNADSNGNRVEFMPRLLASAGSGGSAANPSISFASDPNTGLYFPSADQIGLSTGGAQRLLLSNTGASLTGNFSATGSISASAYAGVKRDQSGPMAMSAGWRRVGSFTASGGNRGHARVTLFNSGGLRQPWVVEIDAFHSYSFGASSLFVKDHRSSDISAVRITNDGVTAYLECNFTTALDSLYFVHDVGGWESGFTLYDMAVGGSGTQECYTAVTGGYSVASTGGSTSYLQDVQASGDIASSRFLGTAGGASTPAFTLNGKTDTGMFGTSNYLGLVKDGNVVLISRTENGDSLLNLGIGNANNRNAYVDFFANGAAPTSSDARIIRGLGANGEFSLINWGTGRFVLNAVNAAIMDLATSNAVRMRILSSGDIGIGTTSPGYKLHVNGVIFGEDVVSGTAIVARGNPGVGFAGSTRITNGTSAGISTSTWDGCIIAYVGTQAVRIPYKI